MASIPKERENLDEQEKPILTAESPAPEKPKRQPLVVILPVALLALGLFYGIKYFVWAKNHVSTDDATIASDVISVAPQVSGTVLKVDVKENELVKKGQILVELDDATFKTAVAQAQANYDLAVAQSKGAVAQTGLTGRIGDAQIVQAQGQVEQSESAAVGSTADVQRSRSAVAVARAQASSATAGTRGAEAALKAAISNHQKALDSVKGAQSVVASSESAVKTAQANAAAAHASLDRARSDSQRAQTLLAQGAISAQEAEQLASQSRVAQAQADAADQQVTSAQSAVEQHRSEVATAQSQVAASEAAITQARAQIQASKDQETAARELISQAESQTKIAQSNVLQNQAKIRQMRGTLLQANTAPVQVEITRSGQSQAEAKVEQAAAALKEAEIQLSRTKIYAPSDGRVSKKTVEVGALVTTGTPLMAILPTELVWITANFKETQLAKMKAGDKVEIVVDGLPGREFVGKVNSMSGGTGATFALLPADNATGNFTKVVQRVPVKIDLDPGQPDMDRLRTGMSVDATVTTD